MKKTTALGNQLSNKLNKMFSKVETILVLCIIVLCVVITAINSVFFSADTLFETLKACVVTAIVGIGVGLVLINGGVDLSCMSIAIFSAYSAIKIFILLGQQPSIIMVFLLAMAIGGVLGLINCIFIAFLKIPIFIATLCLGAIYNGIMLEFIGNIYITPAQMPKSALEFSRIDVFGGLHISVLIMIGLLILTYILLRYTTVGRGLYALGGAPISASRVGYNVKRLNISTYLYAGVMYAIGGVIYVSNSRLADPYDMRGNELTVIAAVILGGISIAGGKGSMLGIILGTLLAVIIRNNLILIGVPSVWQAFVFGLVFIFAIALQAYNQKRSKRQKT